MIRRGTIAAIGELWAAFGASTALTVGVTILLFTILHGQMGGLEQRLTAMDIKFTGQFNAMDAKFTGQFNAIDSKFNAIDSKFTSQIGVVDAKLQGINDRIDRVIEMVDHHKHPPRGTPAARRRRKTG